jgi:DNA-directed RNA polymerase subunit beta
MKEFQALGLDVSIINDEGETLQLKEIEEAEDKEDLNMNLEEVESPAKEVLVANSEDDEYEEDDEFDDEDEFDEEDEDFDEDFDEDDFDEGADI